MSIRFPLSLAPLLGKYYGTQVFDGDGDLFITFWTAEGEPSEREKARFNGRWTPEFWAEYCCDSHWECAEDLADALWLIATLNAANEAPVTPSLQKG